MRQILKDFMCRIKEEKIDQFRCVIVHQDGKLWGEYYHAPRVPYNIHSCAKSFVSTAIGFAIDEGILSFNDKVVDAFPDLLPDKISDWLGGLTLRHLLMMSSGHKKEIFLNMNFSHYKDTDWIRRYLRYPIECEPGTRFFYESGDTYTAGAMLQKKVGMTLTEYLKSRLFDPLQIETPYWLVSPEGYNIGYTGLWLKTEDLIKWAELYRNKGNWHGRQLLSPEWVTAATAYQIDCENKNRETDYHSQGYGYQIILARDGAFYAGGLGGQFSLAVPKCDACIGFSSYDLQQMSKPANIIGEMLVPALAK